MIRQTFYIAEDISRTLKRTAYECDAKISNLVNDALRVYLKAFKKIKKQHPHSLLQGAGKISSFKDVDPLDFQKKARAEWE